MLQSSQLRKGCVVLDHPPSFSMCSTIWQNGHFYTKTIYRVSQCSVGKTADIGECILMFGAAVGIYYMV
jgi:hypothetical protein